ncbi:hypothetical protein P691DRAFT_707172 [Macrolepiota fuliginosa MF-IS2]|uniref:Nuclear condensin complex subunit 3 C-terminal domain-containing protein n=1 Tax=Macrolepiota fuliginosa MF-IS2 TaxID=1400762 RepID=A0A9P5XCB7_9AGAR|nr:hypothetical protein P691DRAFT_707172 [Macrolepiota fuliginosa MF-IS2]
MPGKTRQPDKQTNLEYLSATVPKIFDQVQVSIANHQKNCVALHKIHSDAANFFEQVNNGRGIRLTGERMFGDMIQCMLAPVLPLKKGITTADRVIRFIGAYTKFINEKAAEEKAGQDAIDVDEDTTATRFTARLLKFLMRGVEAKDKNVRYRVLQTLVEMVSHLGEIDEELYSALRNALLGRARDKEAPVRAQAVVALSKLCAAETDEDIENDEISAIDVLLEALAHDPSSDVRRSVLLSLPITPVTIPHILDRMRDTEVTIRRVVFSVVLEPNTTQGDEFKVMGPTHPRAFTISQREQIVRNGVGDREDSVRRVASTLIGSWIDVVDISGSKVDSQDLKQENVPAAEEGVLSLLKLFDLVEGTVARDALFSVFTHRPDIFSKIKFDADYWQKLDPERAFLARVFVDHCADEKDDKRLEEALPTVSALANIIKASWNALSDTYQNFIDDRLVRDFDDVELQEKEDEIVEKEAVLSELLKMAVNLDYSDESGRRVMFPLVREMTSKETLPETLVGHCLDVLRRLAADDKDLIRIVVEIISDLRDPFTDEPEEPVNDPNASFAETPSTTPKPRPPPREKTEAEKKQALDIDSRCLMLSNAMLERVNTTFEENSTLEGLMRDLIVPSIHIKDAHIRERAFVSLGLCCSIARKRALNSVDFFKSQVLSSPDKMKPSLYKIIFDMLMVHDLAFARSVPQKVLEITDDFLITRMREERDPQILAIICLGIAKLVLAGIARDINSVANLMLAFLSPATSGNQDLRQALTCFFPVYSYSSVANQSSIMSIFLRVFSEVKKTRADLEEGEEVATSSQVTTMFIDLTDPNRLSSVVSAHGLADEKDIHDNESLQLKLAIEILKEFLKPNFDFDKDDKKVLCQMFSKLYIPDVVDDELIRRLKLYLDTVKTRRPFKDTTSRNALSKFDALISKKYEKQLELQEEELRKLEELQDLFNFLDDIIPEDDGELVDPPEPKKRGRKRRSMSITTATSDGETPSHESGRGAQKAKKRRRVSGSDDESEEEEEEGTPRPAVKTRVMPKRAATGKISTQPIVITDSEDEAHEELPKKKASSLKAARKTRKVKDEEEEALDRDISQLLEPPSPAPSTPSSLSSLEDDTIVGPDSEAEEEEEVSGLLVED